MDTNSVLNEGLATITDAMRFLSVSRAALYALMARGELPYCKLGRSRRIPRRALVALAERLLVSERSGYADRQRAGDDMAPGRSTK